MSYFEHPKVPTRFNFLIEKLLRFKIKAFLLLQKVTKDRKQNTHIIEKIIHSSLSSEYKIHWIVVVYLYQIYTRPYVVCIYCTDNV